MILRPIEEGLRSQASSAKPRPIWDVIFEQQMKLMGIDQGEHGASAVQREQSARRGPQSAKHDGVRTAKSLATEPWNNDVWLITQPSHSALSGEIAAKLDPKVFGKFDDATIRAIALHDAGWSEFDSELVRASRSPAAGGKKVAVSFVGAPPKVAVNAWTGSVETALKAGVLGGFLVSEHFRSIAQYQVDEAPAKAKEMAAFAKQEQARQKKLRPKISLDDPSLERMADGLRFCDLLSLYMCMGIAETVEFPQKIQSQNVVLVRMDEQTLKLTPSPFLGEEMFSFAALRHPRTKLVSSASFAARIVA